MIKIVLLVFVIAVFSGPATAQMELRSPQVTNWGDWHLWDNCPEGTFVVGMQLRTHAYQGSFSDDSALNGIKFFCDHIGSKSEAVSIVSGQEEQYGDFGNSYFCDGLATGFQLRSEKYQTIFADDTAANNLKLFCNSNSSNFREGDGLTFGSWTAPQGCFARQALCGYASQVDHDLNSGDITGLNNIKMRCCTVPDPAVICVPGDNWDLLIECDNLEATSPTRCEYKRKIGISHSTAFSEGYSELVESYLDLGFSLADALSGLGINFGLNLGANSTTGYNWSSSNSETWSVETTTTVSFEVPPGIRTQLSQTLGKCGIYTVRAPRVKRVDTDVFTNVQTITYLDI